jgi:hypothetical protein
MTRSDGDVAGTGTRTDALEGGPGDAAGTSSRRDLLRSGGTALLASLLGVVGLSVGASAKNGDALRAGDRATASRATVLESSKGPGLQVTFTGKGDGIAVRGSAESSKGIGVQGEATSDKGETVGVQGLAASSEGVAGQFLAGSGGTALQAEAEGKGGVALRTKGRLELQGRSGIASVSGGAEFVIPVSGALTDKSLVLATLQDHFPGVHVESASVLDPEEGLVVVRLNQAVPEPAKVGWLVLD